MAETTPPTTPPDPARSYERAKPEAESGMGRLDNNKAIPEKRPDQSQDAVHSKQDPNRTISSEEGVVSQRAQSDPAESERDRAAPAARPLSGHRPAGAPNQPGHLPPPQPVDHSMHEEEPNGWDQAPTDIHDKEQKRHPRTEGKGGTP